MNLNRTFGWLSEFGFGSEVYGINIAVLHVYYKIILPNYKYMVSQVEFEPTTRCLEEGRPEFLVF